MAHAIERVLGSAEPFLTGLLGALSRDGISWEDYPPDHLCYRVATLERYAQLYAAMARMGQLLSDKMIAGRPIACFELYEPLCVAGVAIPVLELPAPKAGSPYPEGYEHIELVVGCPLPEFMARHPGLPFLTDDIHKPVNPDVRLRYEAGSVKFHEHALSYVVRYLE